MQNAVDAPYTDQPGEPSFSLGLTQEGISSKRLCTTLSEQENEHNCNNVVQHIFANSSAAVNVKDEREVIRRKSMRTRVMPSSLAADYHFGSVLKKRGCSRENDLPSKLNGASIAEKISNLKHKIQESL